LDYSTRARARGNGYYIEYGPGPRVVVVAEPDEMRKYGVPEWELLTPLDGDDTGNIFVLGGATRWATE